MDCLYPLASLGLLLNLFVILLVSTAKELRKSPTMFLILNMAVCDFFMGLWCVLTATFNIFPDSDEDVNSFTYHGKYLDQKSFHPVHGIFSLFHPHFLLFPIPIFLSFPPLSSNHAHSPTSRVFSRIVRTLSSYLPLLLLFLEVRLLKGGVSLFTGSKLSLKSRILQ